MTPDITRIHPKKLTRQQMVRAIRLWECGQYQYYDCLDLFIAARKMLQADEKSPVRMRI